MTTTTEQLQTAGELTRIFAYVGSYTTLAMRGHGEGLNVFQIDPISGTWRHVQLVKGVVDPSFLALDPSGRFLYCVNESLDQISAFSVQEQTGQLTLLNTQSTSGSTPASLSLDPNGRFAVVGNYFGGSLAVLPIEDGRLGPLRQLIKLEGECGPHESEQNCSHPHDIVFDPGGCYLAVPDKGFDRIFVYRFEAESGKLVPNEPPSVAERAGAGPRHIAFHPDQPYAYLINELDSTITTFSYDSDKGLLQPLQTVSTLPPDFTGPNTCAEIKVAPSGKFVYGSNRGHDTIVVYAIDRRNGQLTPVEWVSCGGKTPRFFTLDPRGQLLYVANQDSDTIVTFQIDEDSGKLTSTGQVIPTGSPVCIVFAVKREGSHS